MAEASLPFVELHQVHQCLRHELEKLSALSLQFAQTLSADSLGSLLQQFQFFFVVFHSHSRAEEDVILPALVGKGLNVRANHELENEHRSQESALESIRAVLAQLRAESMRAAQVSGVTTGLARQLVSLMDSMRSSVWLHLKKEEEELFPILREHFSESELHQMAGLIMGARPSELVRIYLDMISQDLPEKDRKCALDGIVSAAKGTRFSQWLELISKESAQELPQENGKECYEVRDSAKGAVAQYHICSRPSGCCVVPAVQQQQQQKFGCKHYKRNCKLYMQCCDRYFCCRICHDEEIAAQSTVSHTGDAQKVTWHTVNRFTMKRMWCMSCGFSQPVATECVRCKVRMARYVCLVCNLFDDADQGSIYHCPYCNICRVAQGLGKDMFHCMKCNVCMSIKHKGNHVCMEDSAETKCSICLDELFTATEPIQRLKCGHVMHRKCYSEFVTTNFKCPTCRKSVCDMSLVWQKYDKIQEHLDATSPKAFTHAQADIHCNDCQQNQRVQQEVHLSHSLPAKCSNCGSYNTEATN